MKKTIDATDLHYRELNVKIKKIARDFKDSGNGLKDIIELKDVIGQRYIGDGLKGNFKINIHGTPGNDLAAFMDGPTIEVFGNGQDGIANTMNAGKIIIHGDAGDIFGYSMRGGELYVKGSVGFRSGIHMKSYKDKIPVIVVGGRGGNFLGEYMAGGIIIVLGVNNNTDKEIVGNYTATGMHGGKIFINGDVEEYKLGKEVKKIPLDKDDINILNKYIGNYLKYFDVKNIDIKPENFIKLMPYTHRPYGKLYAY